MTVYTFKYENQIKWVDISKRYVLLLSSTSVKLNRGVEKLLFKRINTSVLNATAGWEREVNLLLYDSVPVFRKYPRGPLEDSLTKSISSKVTQSFSVPIRSQELVMFVMTLNRTLRFSGPEFIQICPSWSARHTSEIASNSLYLSLAIFIHPWIWRQTQPHLCWSCIW